MTEPNIDPKRWAKVQKMALQAGSHDGITAGGCAMELASYVAGEPWSDHPECACPVIAAFMRRWNDNLPGDERTTLLLPFIPRLVGTKGSPKLEERRSLMAADWLVRVHTPAWLRLAKLNDQAALLEALPEITSMAQVPSIWAPLEAVRKDASAARAAAGDATWDARAALKPTRQALQSSAAALLDRMIEAKDAA